jgi:anti-sigma factor RsiW
VSASCRAVTCLLEGYLDGELEPSQVLEVEMHALDCRTCTERMMLDRAIRAGVRRGQAALALSSSLHDRVKASIIAEKNRPSFASVGTPRPARRWHMAAVSVAALFAVLPFSRSTQVQRIVSRGPQTQDVQAASIGLDTLVDQFVDWHSRPLPPEITNANDMPGFEPYVGVPVKAPPLQPFGAHLVGGRILPLPIRDLQKVAAMLQYTLQNGHRISVYVYDPRRVVANPSHLRPWGAASTSEPVYVGSVRGYTVATAQRQGVGYAVASDLDDDENAELALAAAP